MTNLQAMTLAKPLADLYAGLETDLMHNIADYLVTDSLNTSTAQWKMSKLAQLGSLDQANIKTIASYAGIAPDLLEIALTSAALETANQMEAGFSKLVTQGILTGASVPISTTIAGACKTYLEQAQDSLNLVNTVMQYQAKSIAASVINQTAELANKQDFLDMLNKATGKVVTGIESRTAALSQCITEMTQNGIPAFVDKLGRNWSPEAYINMDIRTTVGNVAHQTQFDRMDAYGITLLEVSSHSGARPKCAKDQGRIFDRTNKSTKYAHWNTSSYGDPDGLLGINCGHQIYPYIEGVNTQTYFPYDEEENAKAYKESQQQRQLERNVRSAKRTCTAMDAIGDQKGFQKASAKLQAEQAKLKAFCTDTGRTYKPDRTATPGYNKSVSSKVVQTNKASLLQQIDNDSESGIITVKTTTITGKPNSITQVINSKGGIDRNYYDSNGNQYKQISNHNHGNAKQHPYGTNSEHAHDYIYNSKGDLLDRPMRELTEDERKENGDIL